MTSTDYKFGTWYQESVAPKDGTEFLAWDGTSYHVVCSHGYERADGGHAWFNGDVYVRVSAWTPLPPPPVTRGIKD
jgi:hypothetical protein